MVLFYLLQQIFVSETVDIPNLSSKSWKLFLVVFVNRETFGVGRVFEVEHDSDFEPDFGVWRVFSPVAFCKFVSPGKLGKFRGVGGGIRRVLGVS